MEDIRKFDTTDEAGGSAIENFRAATEATVSKPTYEIKEVIGSGAYGTVHRCRIKDPATADPAHPREIAAKVLLRVDAGADQQPGANKKKAKFAAREARIHVALDHRNVVRCFGCDIYQGCLVLKMELCLTDLKTFKEGRHGSRLSPWQVETILRQVCSGLKYLRDHLTDKRKHGIVHRDLKPSNVLVKAEHPLWVALADFGMGKVIEADKSTLTQHIGTYHYAAPEILDVDRKLHLSVAGDMGHAADVWSLGVMAYELHVGRRPGVLDDEAAEPAWGARIYRAMADCPLLGDLVLSCLRLRPEERIKKRELLDHPYFQEVPSGLGDLSGRDTDSTELDTTTATTATPSFEPTVDTSTLESEYGRSYFRPANDDVTLAQEEGPMLNGGASPQPKEEEEPRRDRRGLSRKVKWALGIAVFALAVIVAACVGAIFTSSKSKDYPEIMVVGPRDAEVLAVGKTCNGFVRGLPEERMSPVAQASVPREDQVAVCGGYHSKSAQKDCLVYTFGSDTWAKAPFSLNEERYDATSVMLTNGSMMIVGGMGKEGALETTEVLSNGTFSYGPDLPHPAAQACAVTVNSTHVFLAGGYNGSEIVANAYLLNAEDGRWIRLPDMKQARYGHSCGLVGGVDLVVAGGWDGSSRLDVTEIYSLDAGEWTAGRRLPAGAHDMAAVQLDRGTFVVTGGFTDTRSLDDIYEFDGENRAWVERPEKLMRERHSHAAVLVPDKFHLCK